MYNKLVDIISIINFNNYESTLSIRNVVFILVEISIFKIGNIRIINMLSTFQYDGFLHEVEADSIHLSSWEVNQNSNSYMLVSTKI